MVIHPEEIFDSSKDKLFFLLANDVTDNKKVEFTKDSILDRYTKRFHNLDDPFELIADSLEEESMLVRSGKSYLLTDLGKNKVLDLLHKYLDAIYSEILTKIDKSKTFKKVSQRLYGQYLGQVNLTDEAQLIKMISLLHVTESDKILDLGCGIGRITELLQEKTNAYCIGIDIASQAIRLANERNAKNAKLAFIQGDMSEPNFPDDSFDLIVAIDTLYYVNNLMQTLMKLKKILKSGKGEMLIFYSQYNLNNEPESFFTPDGTLLAQFLQKLRLKYDYYEYTENELNHWFRQKMLFENYREQFLKEKNDFIFFTFYEDAQATIEQLQLTPNFKRYLYHVFV